MGHYQMIELIQYRGFIMDSMVVQVQVVAQVHQVEMVLTAQTEHQALTVQTEHQQ